MKPVYKRWIFHWLFSFDMVFHPHPFSLSISQCFFLQSIAAQATVLQGHIPLAAPLHIGTVRSKVGMIIPKWLKANNV